MKIDEAVKKAEHSHVPALDGLRGIAILLVLLNHSLSLPLQSRLVWRAEVKNNILCSTGYGVMLFFVLSGFLITGILLDSKGTKNCYLNFFARRVFRIFPLYYGTILAFWLAAVCHGFVGDTLFMHRLPWLLTYTTNILIAWRDNWSFIFGSHSLGHFWSLAVEEQFYLFWPSIVFFCSTQTLKRICLLAIPLGFASRVVLYHVFQDGLAPIVFFSCQVDSLAIGALLAVLVREREQMVAACAWPLIMVGGGVWLASCIDVNMFLTSGMSGFSLLSAGLLLLSIYHPLGAWFANPVLRAFGKFSYGIYVLHVILLPFIVSWKGPLGLPLFTLVFIALSFCAGLCSWYLYEAHFLRLKRFFPSNSHQVWRPQKQVFQDKNQVLTPETAK